MTGRVILVTGPSGAGRTTAIHALEDLGFEVIDNMPLSLVDRILGEGVDGRPIALGFGSSNRDFSADAIQRLAQRLSDDPNVEFDLLYLDARPDVLVTRYSATRRRHPFAPEGEPQVGIDREEDLLTAVRTRATVLIDTSDRTVHETRDEIRRFFGGKSDGDMAISVQSFSYKRGLPMGADVVFDMRFLKNPHWEPELRPLDGRDAAVQDYVMQDDRFAEIFARIRDMVLALLPAYRDEGKSHLTVSIGCTGGQHRSVAVAEFLVKALAEGGWRVSTRHRELERRRQITAPERE
ncbi:RNase adapter RapZ [Palleronia sp.]|uniref:RNase adapter RapZ n=1 Tax=Palleronia sp. TaxID=1940284 RepID=UPI0035C7DC8B